LLNPLSAEEGYLRMNLLPTLIRRVEGNWAVHTRDVRLFEVGTVFRKGPVGAPPIEDRRVAGVITGGREPAHWTTAGKSDDVDCWDLRAAFEAAVALAQPAAMVQVEGGSWVALTPEGQRVGWAGPQPADAPPWAAPLFGFEVSIDPSARPPVTFTPLPTTPAADRDVALSVPNAITAAVIESTIRASGGPLLESVGVLDEYRGAGLPVGHRSLAFRLRFRATDRTLRDKEVDTAVQRIITALQEQHGIQLRAS
jgi:phenylalanyl-tRNA synthetase beta chain